ncbi:class E sortase [Streptomyces sp. cmx-4-25]|uniref:class E sortase n=1 Tax=Streptomyces sp. cmx-4-25 TaxID=2790933 RepID=UPI0039812AE7
MTEGSPWFRATHEPGQEPIPESGYAPGDGYAPGGEYGSGTAYGPGDGYGPGGGYGSGDGYGPGDGYVSGAEPHAQGAPYTPAGLYDPAPGPYDPAIDPYARAGSYVPPADPYARPEPYAAPADPYASPEGPYEPSYGPYGAEEAPGRRSDQTAVLPSVEGPSESSGPSEPSEPDPERGPGPGRAERRRAAAKGGRGKGRRGAPPAAAASPAAPLSRVEARRAAREAKDSVGVVASRVVGELFITLGVVMLLFVTYQLWWTNVLAGQETNQAKERIEDTWAKGGNEDEPDVFEPGEGFAIMYIPKLDVVVPIAEGINKTKVLDKGMVGHYAEGSLKTAMPSDKQGNFAVAGHRNTHGEPFRYINRLKPGDPIVVETRNAYYTYEMASILPQTAPSNVSVIDPVPKGSGFTEPGRYITLTTCTPEFTSTYRMIVWGRLLEERPRSQGKPEALVG